MASMALWAEQARHTENVFHIALRRCETHPVCLSHSAESAAEPISLALPCTERVFHIALRRCETLWSARETTSVALSAE